MQKSDPIIHTKIRLPSPRPNLVLRPRLQEQILQGLQGPLTVVVAPAGFGKTTLVASCIARCPMPIAWLSLDKNDNQPGRFLNYLVAALHGVDGRLGMEAAGLMSRMEHVPSEAVLTSLINDLDGAGDEMVLALDDYHFISSPSIHEEMAFLLQHCPRSLHILIATRSDPPIPLTRMRARGQMVELRAADLRFTGSEAAQFLKDVMGLDLDAGSVALLEERTEGWVAGLQMAALSLRVREDARAFIQGFSGTNRYIMDYLLEEVLASQPAEIHQFLLRTSILDRLSAPLCAVLLEDQESVKRDDRSRGSTSGLVQRSASILDDLERANLFLIPLDDERIWYRYHHLFADLLRTQLQRSLGDQIVARLHLCASAWYEQNNSILEAIYHAALASDFERVEHLIEHNYIVMMNRGEMSGIRVWMGKFTQELGAQRPWLCLYEAFSRSWFGQVEEAALLLKEADQLIRQEGSASDTQAMLGYYAYVKSRVTAMQGDVPRAIELCLTAREKIPSSNLALQIEIGITLGYEYFLCGDFVQAKHTWSQMIQAAQVVKAINNPVAAYSLLARAYVAEGRLREAYDLVQKAAQLVQEAGERYLGVVGLIEVETAALLCEWNDQEAALTHLTKGLDLLPSWGKADDLCLAYSTLSRIQLALRNQQQAAGAIETAQEMIQSCGVFSEARTAVEIAQAKLWLAQGDWPAIERWLATIVTRFGSEDPFRYEQELTHIMQARIFIRQNKPAEAIPILACLEESARSGGRTGRLIEILLLQALARQSQGDAAQADLALTTSLSLAKPQGYVRIFLDEGGPMQRLLAHWLAHGQDGSLREYASFLLSQFESGPSIAPLEREKASPNEDLIEPLTPRELEVLRLLAAGLSNRQIAAKLFLSEGTVKFYVHTIMQKLGVHSRTQALLIAKEQNLL